LTRTVAVVELDGESEKIPQNAGKFLVVLALVVQMCGEA